MKKYRMSEFKIGVDKKLIENYANDEILIPSIVMQSTVILKTKQHRLFCYSFDAKW